MAETAKSLEGMPVEIEARDEKSFEMVSIARSSVSQSVIFFWGGIASFCITAFLLCSYMEGDAELTAMVHSQVDPSAYGAPMCCFLTALSLNFLTLLFERESIKFQLVLLTCYINLLAALNDYLHWQGLAPIVRDSWGHPFMIVRTTMWLHVTPVMVYLLSIISDFKRIEVFTAILADILMLAFGIATYLVADQTTAWTFLSISMGCFCVTMYFMWYMFSSILSEAKESKRMSIQFTRLIMLGTWFTFPCVFCVARLGVLTVTQEEWLQSIGDFFGKVMFSSSLLLSNFMTLEQRRLVAMHAVEEGNRVTVIQELRDLLEQKERFLSSMSHELRTPLNGIIGLSDALLVGSCGDISENVTKTINTIKISGSRLLNLINDILDAASMKHGTLVIKQEKVNLYNVAQDVVELCQPLAKKGVQLLNSLSNQGSPVLGDTGRIIQIFHNLIGNSCKFTHSGTISISAQRRDDMMEVSVSDTGIGIPEEKHTMIFDAFEQVDASTTRKYGGTGLGLNLVKSLVEAHGGVVIVKSRPGKGTTFIFNLKIWEARVQEECDTSPQGPRSEASESSHAPVLWRGVKKNYSACSVTTSKTSADVDGIKRGGKTSDAEGQELLVQAAASDAMAVSGKLIVREKSAFGSQRWAMKQRQMRQGDKIKVLSVDDDPINQMVIQSLLAPEGYDVMQAMDGEEALDILQKESSLPDIMLIDVMMPGMSGYQLVTKLRQIYPGSCMPMIMISAKSKEEDIVMGLKAGANDYAVKPFGRQEILARVSAHLKFRDDVFKAGEESAEQQFVADLSASNATMERILKYISVPNMQGSLPDTVRVQLENSSGKETYLKVYNQLTMVVANVSNLTEVSSLLSPECMVMALTKFFARAQELLVKHHCYLADTLEGRLVVVSGLSGDKDLKRQVVDAVSFAEDLLEAARSTNNDNADGCPSAALELAVGIHTCASQGVVVGVNHPVLYFTGDLPTMATCLQRMTPGDCILVSALVRERYGDNNVFVVSHAAANAKESTYLCKAGSWKERAGELAPTRARYFQANRVGHINHQSHGLHPVQMSLLTMIRANPQMVLELTRTPTSSDTFRAGTLAKQLSAMKMALSSNGSPEGGNKIDPAVEVKLQHEKDVLTKHLEEVTEEAGRLQDIVDELESQVRSHAPLVQKVASLEAQVSVVKAAHEEADKYRELAMEMEGRLSVLQTQLIGIQEEYRLSCQREGQLEGQQLQLEQHAKRLELELSNTVAHMAQHHRAGSEGSSDQSLRSSGTLQASVLQLQQAQGGSAGSLAQSLHSVSSLQPQACILQQQLQQQHPSHAPEPFLQSSPQPVRGSIYLNQLPGGMGLHHPPSRNVSSSRLAARTTCRRNSSRSVLMQYEAGSPCSSSFTPSDLELLESRLVTRFSVPSPYSPADEMSLALEELGLEYLLPKFQAEEITLGLLPFLDDQALRTLGAVSVGSRLKLRLAARVLGSDV